MTERAGPAHGVVAGGIVQRSLLVGGGSVAALIASVAANKIYSTLLGPEGFGLLALGRSLAWLVSLVGGAALGSVLVREGAGHLARGDEDAFAALKRASLQIASLAGITACVVLILAGQAASARLFGDPGHGLLTSAAGLAGLVTVYAALETGELTARHATSRLARTTASAAVVGAVAGIAGTGILGAAGIPVILLAAPLATWWTARSRAGIGPAPEAPRGAARRQLLRALWPVAAAALLGGAIEYALPLVIVQVAEPGTVGLYRAAHALAVGYLAFVGTILAQEYYPRVAALSPEGALGPVVNAQLRLVARLAGVLTAVGIVAAGPLLRLVFSASFVPAAPLLALLMAGNVVRLPSWCLTYAVLAHASPCRYLALEAWGGGVTLGLSTLGLLRGGLVGLGIGFTAGYVLYFLGAWWTLRRTADCRLERRTLLELSAIAAAVLALLGWTRWA